MEKRELVNERRRTLRWGKRQREGGCQRKTERGLVGALGGKGKAKYTVIVKKRKLEWVKGETGGGG